jgi:CubicO group peptidase (beta-lactamase class C family)
MRSSLLVTFAFLLAPAILPAQQPDPARLDSVFRRWSSKESAGCALAIGQDGQTVLERAWGMADLEHDIANTPATIFEAGSVSKQFTAASVLLLVQEGKLSLDDDIRKYIPEVPDYGSTIRIQHLLNHISGLRDWGNVAAIAGWPRTTRVHTHAHVLDIVSRQRALNFPPGREYSYSNTGYNLLAIVVERVSGMSLAEFSRRRLFEPLGLTHTSWRDDFTRIVKGRAIAYAPRGQGWAQDMPFENVYGNGGLLTTVGDLLIWNENLKSGKVGGPALLQAMHKQGVLNNGRKISYASGLMIGEFNGTPEVSHTGSTAGYRAFLARFPEKQLSIALLCNAANANPGALGGQVTSLLLPAPARTAATPPRRAAVSAADLQRLAQVYRDVVSSEPLRLTFNDSTLRLGNVELIPVSAREFVAGNRRLVVEGGERPRLITITAAGDSSIFEPAPPFTSSAAQLNDFAGEYFSPDTQSTLVVSVENAGLVLSVRPGLRVSLTPVYADAFQAQLGIIRFIRDAGGRVRELSVGQDRVYDLRFSRR